MIIRALDADGDIQFGKGVQSYLTGNDAIAENIKTRLLFVKNDCFFAMSSGIDWMRLLQQKGTQKEIELTCRAVILASYGVVKVNSLSISVTGRKLSITYNIDTIFSPGYAATVGVIS